MVSNSTYTVKVEYNENTDEYYIILPPSLLKKMNWKKGDQLEWIINKDKSITIKKVK